MNLSDKEQSFIETAETRIRSHARERRDVALFDKLYAIVQSETGKIYEGIPFETSMSQFDFCAERHAINNMQYAETEKTNVDMIIIAGPAPNDEATITMPCGACRHAINQFSEDATVFCSNFVRESTGWTIFPRLKRFTATELYPHHEPVPSWE
ncbi:MAG: hypothetical protein ABEI06_01255 [Halobacteriaceae archaeon]